MDAKASLGNVEYPLELLKKHFIALGGSGSGKSVLCKILIEEALMNNIPSIIIDTQGDLSSLAIKGRNVKEKDKFPSERVTVFTPASSKGIPICINPLKMPKKSISEEDAIGIIQQSSDAICLIAGYNPKKESSKEAQAVLYLILMSLWKEGRHVLGLDDLAGFIENPPETIKQDISRIGKLGKTSSELARKIRMLSIGNRSLLFSLGLELDIDKMLSKKSAVANVIYLNTLKTSEEKQFFVMMAAKSLFEWMLDNPKESLQGIFLIDEIADYLPSGMRESPSKKSLITLFKQARKFGVGCIISTQNPGDIDYRAFSQFGTWAVGRLTARQDREKVKPALKSLSDDFEKIEPKLPKLEPGSFLLFCPDLFKKVFELKARWLYSEHKTLNEENISEIVSVELRKKYAKATGAKQKKDSASKKDKVKAIQTATTREDAEKKIEKQVKKALLLFRKEKVLPVKRVLKPVYIIKAEKQKKGLFSGKSEQFRIVFDAENGNIIILRNLKPYAAEPGWLLELSEPQLNVLAVLESSSSSLSADEIAVQAGIPEAAVRKSLKELSLKKMLGFAGKEEKKNVWKTTLSPGIKSEIQRYTSRDILFAETEAQEDVAEKKVSVEKAKRFVGSWFRAAVTDIEESLIPAYEAELSDGKSKRKAVAY